MRNLYYGRNALRHSKEEDLSSFEVTERIEYKLTGEDRYCPDCRKKYKVVTKETVKRLKFVPARFGATLGSDPIKKK